MRRLCEADDARQCGREGRFGSHKRPASKTKIRFSNREGDRQVRKETRMPINSFVFYRSFYEAIETLKKEEDQLKLMIAIIHRGLGMEDVPLSGVALGMFALIAPQLEANHKRYENGKKGAPYGKLGGRPKNEN